MGSCCAKLQKNANRSKRATQEKVQEPESSENYEIAVIMNRRTLTLLPSDHPMASYVFPRVLSEGSKLLSSCKQKECIV